MEVAWNSVDLEVANHLAALLFVILAKDPVLDGASPLVLFADLLDTDDLAELVQSLLVKFAHHICFVGPQNVLDIQ